VLCDVIQEDAKKLANIIIGGEMEAWNNAI
jgi:hypothetical protein